MIKSIGDIFNIGWGQKEYHSKESIEGLEGNVILISSKGENNGVYGFFDIPIKYKAPFITVPSTGTIGQAFVQLYDCCVNDDVLILYPKQKMSIEELYNIAFQIRNNKWKYQYGRKITPKRLQQHKIRLEPLKIKFGELNKKFLPKKISKTPRENKKTQYCKLKDLCNISKKFALPLNVLSKGNTPYVTTTSMDNGVSDFVDEEVNSKGKCLTVALNGSVCEVFFQLFDFVTSGDNAVLTLKDKYNPYLLLYIGALIKTHQWKYSFYRKLSIEKLSNMKLPLPYNHNGLDLSYIQAIIENSYGYESLKKFL